MYSRGDKSLRSQSNSKEKQAQVELVSCLDYYLERHALKFSLNRRMPNGVCVVW